ncbi:MAG: hypothetical protein AAF661_15195, partial [Pseudomonadota bacterium]
FVFRLVGFQIPVEQWAAVALIAAGGWAAYQGGFLANLGKAVCICVVALAVAGPGAVQAQTLGGLIVWANPGPAPESVDDWSEGLEGENLEAATLADLTAFKARDLSHLPPCGSAVYRGRHYQNDTKMRGTHTRDGGDIETLSIMNRCGTEADWAKVCERHPDRTYFFGMITVHGEPVDEACENHPVFRQQVAQAQ